jgi:hypothetical protein
MIEFLKKEKNCNSESIQKLQVEIHLKKINKNI